MAIPLLIMWYTIQLTWLQYDDILIFKKWPDHPNSHILTLMTLRMRTSDTDTVTEQVWAGEISPVATNGYL